MPCPDISLPKIDFSALGASPEARAAELTKLLDCFSGVGFCLVSGVPGYSEKDLFEAVRWFYYDVTEAERYDQLATKAFNSKNDNHYRGYFPFKKGMLSHKQGYDISQTIEDPPEEFADNPLMEVTPRLKLEGREQELDKFHEVRCYQNKTFPGILLGQFLD